MKQLSRLSILAFTFFLLGIAVVTTTAQRPDAPEFALPGAYAIGTMDITLEDATRPLTVTVWYPATIPDDGVLVTYTIGALPLTTGQAWRDAPPDLTGAPYPLVIFSHGSGGMRLQSLYLTEHLASQGFVVIAADHPTNTILDQLADAEQFNDDRAANYIYRPQDVIRLLDYAETLTGAGDWAGLIDMERVAVMGHSFGGYTALAVGGAALNFDQLANYCNSATENPEQHYGVCSLPEQATTIAAALGLATPPDGVWPTLADPRIRAIVAFAPWNGPILDMTTLAQITTPTLFIVGSADTVTPPERDAYFLFSNLPRAPRAILTLENAGHFVFVDECSALALQMGLFNICSDPVWDMTRAHDLIKHLTTAFLRSELYADGRATAALQPGAMDFAGASYVTQNLGPIPEAITLQVIAEYPHDSNAFTQGLVFHEGAFYESAGRYGQSSLRQVNPETGEVLRSVAVPEQYFAEGLALVDDRLIQLTWQEGEALVYDRETFTRVDTFTYTGEGWGLCYDGEVLYRTDGSDGIFLHDPTTFAEVGVIHVSVQGEPVTQLNELECVGDDLYANVWQTDYILRIDKITGYVTGVINARGLLTAEETAGLGSGGVLNGIAYDAETNVFYLTGKLWPKVFAVNFVSP